MAKRVEWIDNARGIGILAIVLGHVYNRTAGLGRWLYAWHIPLFFLLPGVLFALRGGERSEPFGRLVVQKAKSLLFPYVGFSLASVLLMAIYEGVPNALSALVFKVILPFGMGTLWFLPTLFLAEVFFLGVKRGAGGDGRVLAVYALVVVFTTLFSRLNYTAMSAGPWKTALDYVDLVNRALIGSVFIATGYYGAKWLRLPAEGLPLALSVLPPLTATLVLCRYNYVDVHFSIIGNPALFYLLALCGCYAVCAVAMLLASAGLSGAMKYMGRNALIVFATHSNFTVLHYSRMLAAHTPWHRSATFVIAILLELVLIFALNRWAKWLFHWESFLALPTMRRLRRKGA